MEQDRQEGIFEEVGYPIEKEIDKRSGITREMGLGGEEKDKAHPQKDRQPAVNP
jgi:hypothetical protein